MSSPQNSESINEVKGELKKFAQRMEGSSASQIQKAIELNRYNKYIPSWLRPIIFPLSIFSLFFTGAFLFGMIVRSTSIPAPWNIEHESWMWWNFIHITQIVLTGIIYWYGERKFGKMPGIPRGSLYSILVLAALLPGFMFALVCCSYLFAQLHIRRDQSGVWLRSIGGWTKPIMITGAIELIILWISLMILGNISRGVVDASEVQAESTWKALFGWVTAEQFGYFVSAMAVIGLVQALMAAISIITEAAIEEDLMDVTPLLGTLAPLVVLSPICLYMLVTWQQTETQHELWLLIFRILSVLWIIMLIIGLVYLFKRWEIVHQPFLIMLMGYLMLIPFFVNRAASLPTQTPPPVIEKKPNWTPPSKKDKARPSPRAIDILKDE